MKTIKQRLEEINKEIQTTANACGRSADDITLVAVSKKKSVEVIREGIAAGVAVLGENYIQEAVEKIEAIGTGTGTDVDVDVDAGAGSGSGSGADAVSWHFIGHLQSNKAKFAVKYFDLIESVDRLKLAREIDKQAEKIGKKQKILMQINISEEASKSGASADDAIFLAKEIAALNHVSVQGLMGMPPFFDDPEGARPYFKALADIKKAIEKEGIPNISMDHLSMGMSGDFKVAIEEGSTMVRIGTAIFGSRL